MIQPWGTGAFLLFKFCKNILNTYLVDADGKMITVPVKLTPGQYNNMLREFNLG